MTIRLSFFLCGKDRKTHLNHKDADSALCLFWNSGLECGVAPSCLCQVLMEEEKTWGGVDFRHRHRNHVVPSTVTSNMDY